MPVVMRMQWPEVTPEQYDQARAIVKWETDPAKGGLYHVAFFDPGLNVVDVWESAEDFQRFVDERLNPGLAQIEGVEGEPKITINPVHAIYNAAELS